MEQTPGHPDDAHGTDPRRWRGDAPHQILLAEDDDDLRMLLATALRGDGFRVLEAHNGRALLDVLAQWLVYRYNDEPLDLIITDVRMPGFSGLDVLHELHRVAWDTPVVLITAYPDARFQQEARALGAACVFGKPLDLDDLRTVVGHFARHGRAVAPRPWWQRHELFDAVEELLAGRPAHQGGW